LKVDKELDDRTSSERVFQTHATAIVLVRFTYVTPHMPPQQHFTEPSFTLGRSPSPLSQTLACSHAAVCSPSGSL